MSAVNRRSRGMASTTRYLNNPPFVYVVGKRDISPNGLPSAFQPNIIAIGFLKSAPTRHCMFNPSRTAKMLPLSRRRSVRCSRCLARLAFVSRCKKRANWCGSSDSLRGDIMLDLLKRCVSVKRSGSVCILAVNSGSPGSRLDPSCCRRKRPPMGMAVCRRAPCAKAVGSGEPAKLTPRRRRLFFGSGKIIEAYLQLVPLALGNETLCIRTPQRSGREPLRMNISILPLAYSGTLLVDYERNLSSISSLKRPALGSRFACEKGHAIHPSERGLDFLQLRKACVYVSVLLTGRTMPSRRRLRSLSPLLVMMFRGLTLTTENHFFKRLCKAPPAVSAHNGRRGAPRQAVRCRPRP